MKLQIHPAFEKLLRKLTEVEERELRSQLQAEGCRESIKLWRKKIVDGHNRYRICTELKIPFTTEDWTERFKDEAEVSDWIMRHQIGRRNLNANEQTYYLGKIYLNAVKKAGRPAVAPTFTQGQYGALDKLAMDSTIDDIDLFFLTDKKNMGVSIVGAKSSVLFFDQKGTEISAADDLQGRRRTNDARSASLE